MKKKIRLCNDYSAEFPLEIFDNEIGYFTYSDINEIQEYLGFGIPDKTINEFISQQEKWEILYESENPDHNEIKKIMSIGKVILTDLKNIINDKNIEFLMYDEISNSDIVI